MDKQKLQSLRQGGIWEFFFGLIPIIEQIIDEINQLKAAQQAPHADDSTAAVIDSPTSKAE